MSKADHHDAQLILQFYEMRREPRLRQARAFLSGPFKAKTLDEFLKVCPMGSEENASFRQATSYWDMVCAIVKRDLVDLELFFETNGEVTLTWEKVKSFVPELRGRFKQPLFLANLEGVALKREAWLEELMPGYLAAMRERFGL